MKLFMRPSLCALVIALGGFILLMHGATLATAQNISTPSATELVLGRGNGFCLQAGGKTYQGFLAREIVRQALLISAREELHLRVRDVSLGEAAAADVNLDLVCSPGNENLLEILLHGPPSQVSVWQHPIHLADEPLRYDVLLTGMEKYSRSVFVTGLKTALQLQEASAAVASDADSKTATALKLQLLEEMTVPSQFAAIRAAHLLPSGATIDPVREEALIRGYANLGLLTECHWHPAHAAYKARALLYAQRWAAREPQSPRAICCRAYAWFMAGMPVHALADLSAAQEAAQTTSDKLPEWSLLIEQAAQYQVKRLSEYPADEPHFQLARVLSVVIAARAGDIERAKQVAFLQGREVFSPRIFDHWTEMDFEDGRQDVWEFADSHLASSLYRDLHLVPKLPEDVKPLLVTAQNENPDGGSEAELKLRAEVIAALSRPVDPAKPQGEANPLPEPSDRALSEIIREATFLHHRHELYRSRNDSLANCLKGHAYYEVFANGNVGETRSLVEGLDRDAMEWKVVNLLTFVEQANGQIHNQEYEAAERHFEDVTADFLTELSRMSGNDRIPLSRAFLKVDPFNPAARAKLIELDWNSVKDEAPNWVAISSEHRPVAMALAKRFEADGKLELTEELLEAVVQQSGTLESYRELALFYSRIKKMDRWQQTWDQYLESHPVDPQRYSILASLSNDFLRRRDFAMAEKYGLQAAEGGSEIGLRAAAGIYELQEKWDEAEKLYRRLSESSFSYEYQWYLFCRRVGQGDEQKARELAKRYFAEFKNPPAARRNFRIRDDLYDFHLAGTLGLLLDEPGEALLYLQQQFNRDPDPALGLYAALAAVELKQPEVCERWLTRVKKESKSPAAMVQLAGDILKDMNEDGGHGKIEINPVCLQGSRLSQAEQADYFYILGAYYESCGNADNAKHCYLIALARPVVQHTGRTLAGIGLRRVGGSPADYRDRWTAPPETSQPTQP